MIYLEIIYMERSTDMASVAAAAPKTDPKAENAEERILIGDAVFLTSIG